MIILLTGQLQYCSRFNGYVIPEASFPIEKREGKNGLGTAYIHGFHWAIDKGYDYIIEMDADFSHNPRRFSPTLQCLSC